MRYILIPCGKWIPLVAYMAAWRVVKRADPEAVFSGWEWYPVPARHILRDMRDGMHKRITAGISYSDRGRTGP